MGHKRIKYKGRTVRIRKAAVSPNLESTTVLADDAWDYVEMWIKRNAKDKRRAAFFWNQSREFYKAYSLLSKLAAPLPAYYCFLNAAKALLLVKGVSHTDKHGVAGESTSPKSSLLSEEVTFGGSGVHGGLLEYFSESKSQTTHNLKALLYNLPFIHRAFNLTFKSRELFIPLVWPEFVKKDDPKSSEAWICAEVEQKHPKQGLRRNLPSGFEVDGGIKGKWVIRRKKRFTWVKNSKKELLAYYQKVRPNFVYIRGANRLWYLRGIGNTDLKLDHCPIVVMFAVMHRLSELARYDPERLERHFECGHNWLLSSFLTYAPAQFIDEVAAELTGMDILPPSVRSPNAGPV